MKYLDQRTSQIIHEAVGQALDNELAFLVESYPDEPIEAILRELIDGGIRRLEQMRAGLPEHRGIVVARAEREADGDTSVEVALLLLPKKTGGTNGHA